MKYIQMSIRKSFTKYKFHNTRFNYSKKSRTQVQNNSKNCEQLPTIIGEQNSNIRDKKNTLALQLGRSKKNVYNFYKHKKTIS